MLLGAVLLQSTALNSLTVAGIKPDLVLVLVVCNGFLRGTKDGILLGFAGGLLQDIITGGYIGLHALVKAAAGYLAGIGFRRLYRDSRIIAAGLTWLCTVAAQLIYLLLLTLVDVSGLAAKTMFTVIIPTAFYNAFITLLIYGLYYRLATQGCLRPSGLRQD